MTIIHQQTLKQLSTGVLINGGLRSHSSSNSTNQEVISPVGCDRSIFKSPTIDRKYLYNYRLPMLTAKLKDGHLTKLE